MKEREGGEEVGRKKSITKSVESTVAPCSGKKVQHAQTGSVGLLPNE